MYRMTFPSHFIWVSLAMINFMMGSGSKWIPFMHNRSIEMSIMVTPVSAMALSEKGVLYWPHTITWICGWCQHAFKTLPLLMATTKETVMVEVEAPSSIRVSDGNHNLDHENAHDDDHDDHCDNDCDNDHDDICNVSWEDWHAFSRWLTHWHSLHTIVTIVLEVIIKSACIALPATAVLTPFDLPRSWFSMFSHMYQAPCSTSNPALTIWAYS